MDIKQIDAITGEVTERTYTAEEKADYDALVAKAKIKLDAELEANEAKATAKAAVLAQLGITEEQAKLLLS
jgi:hypothetical protein